jgi:hypothetical protein
LLNRLWIVDLIWRLSVRRVRNNLRLLRRVLVRNVSGLILGRLWVHLHYFLISTWGWLEILWARVSDSIIYWGGLNRDRSRVGIWSVVRHWLRLVVSRLVN